MCIRDRLNALWEATNYALRRFREAGFEIGATESPIIPLYVRDTETVSYTHLGPSTGFYSELAAANKVVLVASLFEKRAPGLYPVSYTHLFCAFTRLRILPTTSISQLILSAAS